MFPDSLHASQGKVGSKGTPSLADDDGAPRFDVAPVLTFQAVGTSACQLPTIGRWDTCRG